jgi:protein-S-isoprenylcysteine O-methyltransferase Ste14
MSADWLDDPVVRGAAQIYLPLAGAVIARLARGPKPRQFAACLLSMLWTVSALLAVQFVNFWAGWWTFPGYVARFAGMPAESFIGWAVLWGLVPQLVFPRLRLAWVASIMIAADLACMPLCHKFVHLGPHWLFGEALAIVVVLAPALCVARWTFENSHLRMRCAIQVATSALTFLFLVPAIVFALRGGKGWEPLLQSTPGMQIGFGLLMLIAVPGVSAVMEFAGRGGGTPVPYDPPQRLVTSGIYRYCANPMQISCALIMLFWAALLSNGWLAVAALMSAIYSAGMARWDEGLDLAERFGDAWYEYRKEVHDWRVRWRPYDAGTHARIYIAATCGPCSDLRRWIEARKPVGLEIVDAEVLPAGAIRRMRYDPGDGTAAEEGVRAMGRVLEHLNFGWAFVGATLRLPGIWRCVQPLMDASGLGPRELPSTVYR